MLLLPLHSLVHTPCSRRVRDVQEGDEVIAASSPARAVSTHADLTNVPAVDVAPKPRSVTHAQAAAFPFVALTAHSALFSFGGLHKGQRVLVHGCGGVGKRFALCSIYLFMFSFCFFCSSRFRFGFSVCVCMGSSTNEADRAQAAVQFSWPKRCIVVWRSLACRDNSRWPRTWVLTPSTI